MDAVAYVPVSKKHSISIRSGDNFKVKRIHVSSTSRVHKAHTLIHIWDTNVTTLGFVWTVDHCQAYTGRSEKNHDKHPVQEDYYGYKKGTPRVGKQGWYCPSDTF